MPRLDDMSLSDIERGGQRFYERLGWLNGEDAEPERCACGQFCGWCNPEDTLQPWEVEPRDDYDTDDEIIADPPERDEP